MLKKQELAKEAKQELNESAEITIDELRKQAQEEAQREVKEAVKKELIKRKYDEILKEERTKLHGEHEVNVPVEILLGEKRFVGPCKVSLDELLQINEILSRANIERGNQTQRKEYHSQTTMSGNSGQVLDQGLMRRKV